MKQNLAKISAASVAKIINAFLRTDANSASCLIVYQPKAPKELAGFRKTK